MNYIKLSEVTLLENIDTEPNVLAEVNGEVVRIPASEITASQIKADWSEEDPNSPAYIINKPDSLSGSAKGVEVRYYTAGSGTLTDNATGTTQTRQEIIDAWEAGVVMRIGVPADSGNIHHLKYTVGSGSISSVTIGYYHTDGSMVQITI